MININILKFGWNYGNLEHTVEFTDASSVLKVSVTLIGVNPYTKQPDWSLDEMIWYTNRWRHTLLLPFIVG